MLASTVAMSSDESFEPVLEICLCANLRKLSRLVTRRYDSALRPMGMTAAQFAILSFLVGKQPQRHNGLATVLGMDPTTLTRNLQRLMKKGWIDVERAEDQRVRLIVLTPAGHSMQAQAQKLWTRVQTELASRLGVEQSSQFLQILEATADLIRD